MSVDPEHVRMAEALLFAASEPLDEKTLAARLPEGAEISAILETIQEHYQHRGVNLTRLAGKWTFLTAPDLSWMLEEERQTTRRLSRAALETLAIIAYHQPATRAEIEEIRGVGLSRGDNGCSVRGWVDQAAWTPPDSRASCYVWHNRRISYSFWPR